MSHSRLRPVSVALAAGTLAAVAAVGAIPAAALSAPVWKQISTSKADGLDAPSMYRFGNQLQIVWTQPAGTKHRLMTRILSASGAPLTAPINVLGSDWATLGSSPVILPHGTGRLIVFEGIQDGNTGNPYSGGENYYATSTNGKTWTLGTGSLSHGSGGGGSLGAVNDAGNPVVAWPGGVGVLFHKGIDASIPATSADGSVNNGGCCTAETGVGRDAKTGAVWTVWYSNTGHKNNEGLDAARLEPTKGPVVHVPGSAALSYGTWTGTDPNHNEQVAARPKSVGGGLYIAYAYGYPSHRIAVWRLGASKPALIFNGAPDEQKVSIAAGTGGRLWIWWYVRSTGKIHVVRTNPALTHLGITRVFNPPGGIQATVSSIWGISGRAVLDLVAISSKGSSITPLVWHTQVLEALRARVSPATIAAKTGGTITVTVGDAGAAVQGAKVTYNGVSKTTGVHGTVTFKVAKNTSKGTKTVKVTHTGYASVLAHFRVT